MLQLAGEGSGHFDVHEFAFDATFDDEYAEQEVRAQHNTAPLLLMYHAQLFYRGFGVRGHRPCVVKPHPSA